MEEKIKKEKLEKLKQVSNQVLKIYGTKEDKEKFHSDDNEQDER